MIISFIGHSSIPKKEIVKEKLFELIGSYAKSYDVIMCYLGGHGDFDEIAACACRKLKKHYPTIKLIYVTPYISLREQDKIREMIQHGLYDSSLYPPIETVPNKFAISKRNEWMMKEADIIIAYVNRSFGGAYKSLEVARRAKKSIVNICDFI